MLRIGTKLRLVERTGLIIWVVCPILTVLVFDEVNVVALLTPDIKELPNLYYKCQRKYYFWIPFSEGLGDFVPNPFAKTP